MADPVGEAFVEIRPDMARFSAELRVGLEKAATTAPPVPIHVRPQLTRFKSELRAQIRANVLAPVPVPVTIVPKIIGGVQKKLQAEVLAKMTRPIPIPVVPTVIGGGAVAAATAGQAALGGAVTTTTRAIQAETGSQIALTRATETATAAAATQGRVVTDQAIRMSQLKRGLAATALSTFGLRGATLAASGAFLAGAATVTAFAKAVGTFVSFSQQIATFKAVTGATAAEMERVAVAARELGRDLTLPGVTAGDAAQTMLELAKAGLSVEDAIAGARGVLQLAGAANISFADATTLAASAINAFGLSGRDAVHVADVFANAANAAQGSIVDMGTALQQSASVAHQVGLSFEDTNVFLTAFARAGLTSSDAGTSLRTALIRLINPSKKAQEIFRQLGLEVRDAQGNLRPEFFTNLGTALAGMSAKQRDATLAVIGGQDAIRALSIASKLSIDDLLDLRTELNQQGTAADVNAARMSGLAGAGAKLQNTVSDLALSIGHRATPALISLTDNLTNTITAMSQSSFVTGTLNDSLTAAGIGFHALGTAIQTVAPLVGGLTTALSTVTGALGAQQILIAAAAFFTLRKALAAIAVTRAIPLFAVGGAPVAGFTRDLQRAAIGARQNAKDLGLLKGAAVTAAGGFAALGTKVGAFLKSGPGIALVGAAAAAGLYALFTREGAVATATRKLKEATDELAGSLAKASAAQKDLASATQQRKTLRLAVETAKLSAEEARLAAANAAPGTFEKEQAENRLKVALQDEATAELNLAAAIDTERKAKEGAAAATRRRHDDAQKETVAIEKLVAELRNQARIEVGVIGGQRGQPRKGATEAHAEAVAREHLVRTLRLQAQTEQNSEDEFVRANATRKQVIAGLIERLKDIPDEQTISLLVDTQNVEDGLTKLIRRYRKAGQDHLVAYLEGFRHPAGGMAGAFSGFIDAAVAIFKVGAERIGAEWARDTVDSMVRNLAALQGKVAPQLLAFTEAEIGGSLQQQLALAKQIEATANKTLAQKKALRKRGLGGVTDEQVQQAADDALAAKRQRESIEGQITAQAKQGESKREQDARDAEDARNKADQAFLDAIGAGKSAQQQKILMAQATAGINDDIAAQEKLQTILRRDREKARTTIKDAKTKAETVAGLSQEIEQSTQTLVGLRVTAIQQRFEGRLTRAGQTDTLRDDIRTNEALAAAYRTAIAAAEKNIKNERERNLTIAAYKVELGKTNATLAGLRKQQEEQQQSLRERSLDLDVEFAQIHKNVSAEIRAHQAEVRFWTNIQNHAKKGSVEYKEARNRIAQENAEIAELTKTQDKQRDAAKELLFSFLQTQQGFTSTILGNLIPVGATAGSVGGTAGAISTPTAGGGGAIAGPERTTPPDVQDAMRRAHLGAQAAAGPTGASSGQMATLIQLMRQLVAIVGGQKVSQQHPEAHTHNARQSVLLTTHAV